MFSENEGLNGDIFRETKAEWICFINSIMILKKREKEKGNFLQDKEVSETKE